MSFSNIILFIIITTISLARGTNVILSAKKSDWVEDTNVILKNPGMGFTLWSANNNPKPHPNVSVIYNRFTWSTLEPQEGVYSWTNFDNWMTSISQKNMTFATRLMAIGSETSQQWTPQWMFDKIPAGSKYQVGGEWIYDFSVPVVMSGLKKMISAFGNHINGNPHLSHIDVGGLGRWGEWHMSGFAFPMPNYTLRKEIIDAHFDAFPDSVIVMQTEIADDLKYAVSRGAGARGDCFGDYDSSRWCHMVDRYPQMLALVPEAWKTHPIVWETCWTIQTWLEFDMDLRQRT